MKIREHKNDKHDTSYVKIDRNHPIKGNEDTYLDRYNFATIISGPSNSGKTSFLLSQLTHKKGLLFRKFHRIYIFSPSLHTALTDIHLPEENIHQDLDWEIVNNILNENKQRKINGEESQILLIFDDLISEIAQSKNIDAFSKLILNRAHYYASVIITTQAYGRIPLYLRKNFSVVCQFKASNREMDVIRDELTQFNEKEWKQIMKYVFDEKYNYLVITNENKLYKKINLLEIEE